MRLKSPTITLLTGAGLFVALLAASMLATAQSAAPSAPAPARSPARSEDARSPQASPSRTSPAPAPAPARVTYVAHVHGGDTAVAISVSGERASAYVCKGAVIEARLSGAAAGGNLTLTGRNHAQLRATYNLSKAVGDVLAGGIRYTFSAPASQKSSAGPESARSRCERESRVGTSAGQGSGGGQDGGDDGHGGGHGGGGD
jgi:uncharacterized membrane protein YgcG